ncbi:MAG TPA: DUF2845 domain-containing protein [Xanthomonadales bacterium]|nr:DUF2845 domain-containing protein [Xanthomonadales bacterium]
MRSPPAIAVVLLAAFALQAAWADSYRCGRKLIRSGDAPADVLRVCGAPHRKDRAHERVVVDGAAQNLPVERWYYRQHKRSLEHAVVIYRGKVVAIEVGSR